METKFNVSERTNKFVVAIQKLNEAEGAVLDALCESYGETHGDEMSRQLPWDVLNDELLRCMRVSMLENLNDNPTTI